MKRSETLDQLCMKPGDAFNVPFDQIELRKGLPDVTTQAPTLLSACEQAVAWTESMGAY